MKELYEISKINDHGDYIEGMITVSKGFGSWESFWVYPKKSLLRDGNKISKSAIKKSLKNPKIEDNVF